MTDTDAATSSLADELVGADGDLVFQDGSELHVLIDEASSECVIAREYLATDPDTLSGYVIVVPVSGFMYFRRASTTAAAPDEPTTGRFEVMVPGHAHSAHPKFFRWHKTFAEARAEADRILRLLPAAAEAQILTEGAPTVTITQAPPG